MRIFLLLSVLAPWCVWSLAVGETEPEQGQTTEDNVTGHAAHVLMAARSDQLTAEKSVADLTRPKDVVVNDTEVLLATQESPAKREMLTEALPRRRGDIIPVEADPTVDSVTSPEQPRDVSSGDTNDVMPPVPDAGDSGSTLTPSVSVDVINRDVTSDDVTSEHQADDDSDDVDKPTVPQLTRVVSCFSKAAGTHFKDLSSHEQGPARSTPDIGALLRGWGHGFTRSLLLNTVATGRHNLQMYPTKDLHAQVPTQLFPQLRGKGHHQQILPEAMKGLQCNPWLHCRLLDLIRVASQSPDDFRGRNPPTSRPSFQNSYFSKFPRLNSNFRGNFLPEYTPHNLKSWPLEAADGLLLVRLLLSRAKSGVQYSPMCSKNRFFLWGKLKPLAKSVEEHPHQSVDVQKGQQGQFHHQAEVPGQVHVLSELGVPMAAVAMTENRARYPQKLADAPYTHRVQGLWSA